EHPGHAVEHVDAEPGVVGHRGQPGLPGHLAGLEQRVLLEGDAGLGHVADGGELLQPHDVEPGEDAPQLSDLAGVAGGEQDPHADSASCWMSVSSSHPATARSSSRSSFSRSKGAPSAVPCTSTKVPSPVMTPFMSVSAATSST